MEQIKVKSIYGGVELDDGTEIVFDGDMVSSFDPKRIKRFCGDAFVEENGLLIKFVNGEEENLKTIPEIKSFFMKYFHYEPNKDSNPDFAPHDGIDFPDMIHDIECLFGDDFIVGNYNDVEVVIRETITPQLFEKLFSIYGFVRELSESGNELWPVEVDDNEHVYILWCDELKMRVQYLYEERTINVTT